MTCSRAVCARSSQSVNQHHPRFSELLARADDETLQQLVGSHIVRLLSALDPQLATPSNLRRTCMKLNSPEALLRDRGARSKLVTLLRPEHAVALATQLGLDPEDPYRSILTSKIRKNSSQERQLFGFFGVVPEHDSEPPEAPAAGEATTSYGLFDHQRRAQREVIGILAGPEPRVMLHMPTGAGKTRTAMHVVATALRQREPSVVVWLAYSDELCDQAASEFERAWSHLGDRHVDLYRFWGSGRDLDISDICDGFVVAGLAKTFERAKRDGDFIARLADRTSLVVIDEAHQAIAETYSFVLDYLVERHVTTGLLGLTATPGRTWNDPVIDESLAAFFRGHKVTLGVPGYVNPVDYLIAEGYLARPLFRSLAYVPGEPLTNKQLRLLASALDVPEDVLQRLAEDEQRNLAIVHTVEDLARRHERVLVFAATVSHATLLATVLQARGLDAAAVTGATPRDERSRVITRYKNSDPNPRILCNYGVLTAGFDAPRTSAAIVARPTKSLVLYSQMIGRATRGPRAGGNLEAEIITVADTLLPGFGDMSDAFRNWEDVWDE